MSYVITGSPGVGKHSIAEKISKEILLPIIDINKIAQDFGLFEKNKETNDVDVLKLKKVLNENFPNKGIFVGHLAPYVLSSEKIEKVIVLRRSPYELISIYKKRNYSKEKIKDNVGSEILGIIFHDALSQFGIKKTLQIDVSSQEFHETVPKVIEALTGNPQIEEIDWLTTIYEKNDLKEFFAY